MDVNPDEVEREERRKGEGMGKERRRISGQQEDEWAGGREEEEEIYLLQVQMMEDAALRDRCESARGGRGGGGGGVATSNFKGFQHLWYLKVQRLSASIKPHSPKVLTIYGTSKQ